MTTLESWKGGYGLLNHSQVNLERSEPPSLPCEVEITFLSLVLGDTQQLSFLDVEQKGGTRCWSLGIAKDIY